MPATSSPAIKDVRIEPDPPDRLAVRFPYDPAYPPRLRRISGYRWNDDKKVWTFPLTKDALAAVVRVFRNDRVTIDPRIERMLRASQPDIPAPPAHPPASTDLETLRREMRLRNYSLKTIKAYQSCIRALIQHTHPVHPRALTDADIKKFLIHLVEHGRYSSGTINQIINALRFLYVEIYKRPLALGEIPRPKKERKLPVVLSQQEVLRIFDALTNMKHRVMLMLVYSAGLRVGEVVALRHQDIDSDRMMVHIRGGKGKKDRYTILSPVVLEALRQYWKQYTPREWLFEGQIPGKRYSIRSAEKVFETAVQKAGITKDVSIHSLRHAFATHMLEQGTDLRFIQTLLGHSSIKTTEIYTHVTHQKMSSLLSPIDRLTKRP